MQSSKQRRGEDTDKEVASLVEFDLDAASAGVVRWLLSKLEKEFLPDKAS